VCVLVVVFVGSCCCFGILGLGRGVLWGNRKQKINKERELIEVVSGKNNDWERVIKIIIFIYFTETIKMIKSKNNQAYRTN